MEPPPPEFDASSAVGEVRVLVFAMKPGQCEVRVRYPQEALSGQAGAAAKQDAFHSLVMAELQNSLRAFRRHTGR